ncbi:hypothetical protein IH879_12000 [candidate division KSB1 bacterium]|nr:hypothetical protein [candidate division KSB1 bacterium]
MSNRTPGEVIGAATGSLIAVSGAEDDGVCLARIPPIAHFKGPFEAVPQPTFELKVL